MTPEQINIAIAVAAGIVVFERDGNMICARQTDEVFQNLQESPAAFGRTEADAADELFRDYPEVFPNYHGSLDACAGFEATLTRLQYENYCAALAEMCERAFHAEHHIYNLRDRATATAAQRAEAFLRTLNLWKQ